MITEVSDVGEENVAGGFAIVERNALFAVRRSMPALLAPRH
jgi:hypothetical protein